MKKIAPLFLLLFSISAFSQTTLYFPMETEYYYAIFEDGGNFDNVPFVCKVKMNGELGNKKVVAWRKFRTDASGASTCNRSLQVGDEFVVTLSARRARGRIGFALLASPSGTSSWDDRENNYAISINLDGPTYTGNGYDNWYIKYSGGSTSYASFGALEGFDTYFTFTLTLIAADRMNVSIYNGSTTSNFYDVQLNTSDPITDYSIFLHDGYTGTNGYSSIYWGFGDPGDRHKLTNTGSVSIGNSNESFIISSVIPNGFQANSNFMPSTNHLTKEGTGTITLSAVNTYSGITTVSAGTLSVAENYVADDATVQSGATLIINGNPAEFVDLTINNGGFLSVNANKALTVEEIFYNYGTFTINSDETGTGSLITGGSQIINFERYVTGNRWHYVSSPVAGQAIDGDYMTNNSIYSPNGGTNYNFYRWDEPTNYWIIYGDALFGDATFAEARGYAITRTSAGKLSFTGTVRISNVTYPATYNSGQGNGFNLVGNPFTSSLMATTTASATLNFLTINTDLLDDNYEALYIWDEQTGYSNNRNDYKVISNSSITGYNSINQHYVSPGQAFMVKVASAGNLAFNTNMQAHNDATFYKNSDDVWPSVELIVENNELFNSTAIGFNENMTKGLDPSYDIGKLKGNPDIALYTKLIEDNGIDFVIQALPYFEQNYSVKVGLDIANAGEYTFTAATIEQIPEYVYVYFEDKLTGTVTNLKETDNYTCVISESGNITNRFVLHFTLTSVSTEKINANHSNIQIWSSNKTINILNPENLKGQIRIVNIYGQKIIETRLNGNDRQRITINIPTGNYVVNIVDNSFSVSKKIFVK